MSFELQHSTMSPVLHFDIITLIIDIVGENEDTNLLKELALVSHSFLQICSKHLFATIELYDDVPKHNSSSEKGFFNLLKSRPDVVKFIRKLTYRVSNNSTNNYDHRLSPILRSIPRLNYLTITSSGFGDLDWNRLDSSLTSVFLHLMHLSTINYITLTFIQNFPLSSLTPSVNLHRLEIFGLKCFDLPEKDGSPEIVVLSEMLPKIREFHTSYSTLLTTKLLHAKRQDGRPAFNFMDLRRLSIDITGPEDERNTRYLLQNAKLLEKLYLQVENVNWSLVGLHDILSPAAHTLKVLDLTLYLYDRPVPLPLGGLCEELEAMAGHNMLEALSFKVYVNDRDTVDFIGSIIQEVGKVLVKPGWSALKQVFFKVLISCWDSTSNADSELFEALQSLPDKYLSHLPKLESVAFDYSVALT
jgi:hypothetical protein